MNTEATTERDITNAIKILVRAVDCIAADGATSEHIEALIWNAREQLNTIEAIRSAQR